MVPPDCDDASSSTSVAFGVAASSDGGGKENVAQVITDNASNCASMGRNLEAEFPSIVWTPCASHCIDLLLKDIGELPWVKDILSEALSIVTFINSKVKKLAIFRTYSDLELKKASTTQFAAMWAPP
ncbi:hypothetical protein L7F22_068796 [Adiantum nelumboides]|nr:hypothetical protein [Adiantum nelumboides]